MTFKLECARKVSGANPSIVKLGEIRGCPVHKSYVSENYFLAFRGRSLRAKSRKPNCKFLLLKITFFLNGLT